MLGDLFATLAAVVGGLLLLAWLVCRAEQRAWERRVRRGAESVRVIPFGDDAYVYRPPLWDAGPPPVAPARARRHARAGGAR